MSIINEALKKTEAQLQKNADKENSSLPAKPAQAKRFILYFLILLTGLLLGNFIFSLLKHRIQTTQPTKKVAFPITQTTNPAPIAPLPSPPPTPEITRPSATSFVLNGIFFSDNDSYALINNQIVRANDLVDGAKVGLITANTVELDNAGQAITLTTHR